jgi:O-antigen ligase
MFTHHRSPADEPLKYERGTGARVPPEKRPLQLLEWAVLLHVGILLVGITWAFGGGAEAWRPAFAWWGSVGFLLTLTAVRDRDAWRDGWNRPIAWLWPIAAFNVLVLASCLNPSFRERQLSGESMFLNTGGNGFWPSTVQPAAALQGLWYFDSLWIACFNVALVVRQRRAIRALLLVASANALVLAIFGTVQKLTHASGPYFGAVETRQPYFFASFIYHNHWGAFVILMVAASVGLIGHFARRANARDSLHSPAFAGVVALVLVAATVPLSGSRSSTMLITLLCGGACLHWIVRLVRRRRRLGQPVTLPVLGALAAIALAIGGVWFIGRETIEKRAALTRDQVQVMLDRGSIGSRATLYRDTWRMGRAKPWFGWGTGSYPHVFTMFNSQQSVDRLPVYYHDAHSDWLQSFAEHGLVGSALLALTALVPLTRLRKCHFASAIPTYLLVGCGLILLYAWVEFPFGNLAVVLAWWMCFFAAVQYARLQEREAAAPVKIVPPTATA